MLLWQSLFKKAPLTGAFLFVWLPQVYASNDCRTSSYDEQVTVEKVYDGDTLRLSDGRKVRLIAINTPEIGHAERADQPYAREAKESLIATLGMSRTVKLKFGQDQKDRHKRFLAHVFTEDGRNVAAALIRQGYGFAIVVPPNTWGSDCYFALERTAKNAGLRVWNEPEYSPKKPRELGQEDTGFILVEGVVTRIGRSKKNVWLDLGSNFSIKVSRKYLNNFTDVAPEDMQHKLVRVRGWAAFYNGKLRMSLRHPYMNEILTEKND